MKKIIYTIIALISPLFVYAQNTGKLYLQDVDGVDITTKMTYEQVVAKFGQPDEVYEWDEDFPEGSKGREYQYGESMFRFSDRDGLIEFGISDDRFAVITHYIEGGLRVGDPLSKIQNVNVGGPLKRHSERGDGTVIYHLFSESDDRLWIYVNDGVITNMDFSVLL